jgi:hypothetical protein
MELKIAVALPVFPELQPTCNSLPPATDQKTPAPKFYVPDGYRSISLGEALKKYPILAESSSWDLIKG